MSDNIHASRLSALRAELLQARVDGFIIPRTDEYQGEYVPACAERLRFMTGFTGSAGYAVVLPDRAAVFSDGRYSIQLKQQVDETLYETGDSTKQPLAEWLAENARGRTVGFDPVLHTPREIRLLTDKGVNVKALAGNPVDAVWQDRPLLPFAPVELFPLEYAGKSAAEKLDEVSAFLKKNGLDAAMIALPDSIAWLLNVRSNDIPHIPVPLSYGIATADGTFDWFIDERRVGDAVREALGSRVRIFPPLSIVAAMGKMKGRNVLADQRRISVWFTEALKMAGAECFDLKDPCIALKAQKNDREIAAMQAAHRRDGAAVTKFLAWFDQEAAKGGLDEIKAEQKLEDFRKELGEYRDSSFDTIAGFGPNGAIVHYRATEQTNRRIESGGLLLLDSGAQYADGTTDITRTIAVGEPDADMKKAFTLVLKGHIALATARFPEGTTGAQLDILARAPLWQHGMDYAHGTGHGVGCYLSVHEESASISPRGADPVLPGMILSNEPGYYEEGAFGIRIENLILCRKDGVCAATGKNMLSFETLTLAPIDPALIEFSLLTAAERRWLIEYHGAVLTALSPVLGPDALAFVRATYNAFAREGEE